MRIKSGSRWTWGGVFMGNVFDGIDLPASGIEGFDLDSASLDQPREVVTYQPGVGYFIRRYYLTAKARWSDDLPDDFDPHPTHGESRFDRARAQQYKDTKYSLVEVVFNPMPEHPDGGATAAFCPPDEINEQAGVMQNSILLHPKFLTTWVPYWNFKEARFDASGSPLAGKLEGLQFYDQGTFLVTHTQYFAAKPSGVDTDINQLVDPPGNSSSGGLKQWKVQSGSRNTAGDCWAKTLVYEYNKAGWNEEVYPV